MLIRLYDYAHDVLGIHFWDIPAIIVLVLIVIVAVVHTIRQKKREQDFEDEQKKSQRDTGRKFKEDTI